MPGLPLGAGHKFTAAQSDVGERALRRGVPGVRANLFADQILKSAGAGVLAGDRCDFMLLKIPPTVEVK